MFATEIAYERNRIVGVQILEMGVDDAVARICGGNEIRSTNSLHALSIGAIWHVSRRFKKQVNHRAFVQMVSAPVG